MFRDVANATILSTCCIIFTVRTIFPKERLQQTTTSCCPLSERTADEFLIVFT